MNIAAQNIIEVFMLKSWIVDFEINMCEVGGKVDLNTSVIIKKLREVSADE